MTPEKLPALPEELARRIAAMEADFSLTTHERSRFWAQECRRIVEALLAHRVEQSLAARVLDQPIVAYLHVVVSDDGEQDHALSFSRGSFPLQGVVGYRSLSCKPLYEAAAPAPANLGAGGVTEEAILQAVARGWCSPENENKVVDPELAMAIAREVVAALGGDK